MSTHNRRTSKFQAPTPKKRRRPDELVPCIHECCPSKIKYRKGQSSSWRGHVSLRSAKVHSTCTPNCPGWEYLPPLPSSREIPSRRPSPVEVFDNYHGRDRSFTLLWILDPTNWSQNVESTETETQWYDVSLQEEDKYMLRDKTFKGFIFRGPDGNARICEDLDLYRRLPSNYYEKCVMSFSAFRKIVMDKEGKGESLRSFSVVILPFISIDLWSSHYGFKKGEVSIYLENLAQLEEDGIHFWPPFKECVSQADKVKNVQQFDDIAMRVTRSPRPTTRAPINIDDIKKDERGVIKRTFSDKSENVYILPEHAKKIKKSADRPGTQFLWQEYIPSLKKYGELRVGISFGEVIWRVWTRTTDEDGIQYEFCDVTHPKRILNVPMGDLPDEPFDNDYNQIAPLYKRNLREIDDFAVETLRELILLKKASLGFQPSLATFARVDLGIMADQNGKAKFFVNEVESLPNVTIWRGEDHAAPIAAGMDTTIYNVTLARLQSTVNDSNV